MSEQILSKPIYLKDLSRCWQEFIRRCVTLLYGDLLDCRIGRGAVISVGRVIGKHTPNPGSAGSPILEDKPLPKNWVSFIALCARPGLKEITSVKIENGGPVLEFTDEGRWSFDDSS